MREREEFTTLDAMRGVAAIAVMLFHVDGLGSAIAPGGFMAVDIFFVMSGFVIARAYRERLAGGMAVGAFMRRRIIRLLPMLLSGAVLGMTLFGGHAGLLLLVPDFTSEHNLFPANPPFWSLFFEALFYAAFAAAGWRLRPRALLAIIFCGGTILALATLSPEPFRDYGTSWHYPVQGVARVSVGFAWGLLLHWAFESGALRCRETKLGWLPIAAFVALAIIFPAGSQIPPLLCITIVLPFIVALAISWRVPQGTLTSPLAALSYPLYCIHMPLIAWLATDTASVLLLIVALPAASLALERFYERPARQWLERLWPEYEGANNVRHASA